MLLKIVYLLVRQVPGLAILMFRGDGAKEAELLVLRHENAVLRRYAGRVRYEPADRVWFAALARLLPQALDRYLPRDASNAPGLAPQAGREEVLHQQPTQAWPPANSPEHRLPCCPAGKGESTVGIPPDPRRADETRSDGRAVHGAGDPACCEHRSGAPPVRPDLAAVPACQAAGILAVDFLHVDTVLLRRLHVSVLIEHGTRQMHLGGVTSSPTGEWTVQQARNLALSLDKRFGDMRFLIRDLGPDFTRSFDAVFEAAGTRILRCAAQAPRMNAICERLVGTLRRETLDRVLILGEAHLRSILAEYQAHYNNARPHQGIAQRIPAGERDAHRATLLTDIDTGQIRRKPVLGGLINEYTHAA